MKFIEGKQSEFELWTDTLAEFGNVGLSVLVNLVADQIEAWVQDGLSLDHAFKRMVRDKPYLVDPASADSAAIRIALAEYWEHGETFGAFLTAWMSPENR